MKLLVVLLIRKPENITLLQAKSVVFASVAVEPIIDRRCDISVVRFAHAMV